MKINSSKSIDVFGATLSRRQFVKTSGVLAVGISFAGSATLRGATPRVPVAENSLDPYLATSWLEIHEDNTVTIRTGKSDFGQGSVYTSYRQIVAEELSMPFEAITTVVTGSTHETPDGGGSFGFLNDGTPNLRKVAAYTYQALLDLAATKLGVPKSGLTVKDGVVSGGGKSISYGDLVKGQQLKLTIPVSGDLTSIVGLSVDGNPPLKPVSEYTVIGKSFPSSAIQAKVTAKANWATDVRLPGMLHGRVVHPKTLGSTLESAGKVDKTKYPNSQVIVKGNLVGVVAPTEWEAIQAAMQVAADTKWTDWKGLPGSAKLYDHLRNEADWKSTPVTKGRADKGDAGAALGSASKKLSASYQVAYMKHAPIGPTMAVGDVHADGMVHIHTHNQNPQQLRAEIAKMLGVTIDKVIVHNYAGPGHYGRSNGGNAGAEDEAVLLSQAVGKPVRVQWMRADDMQWSTQSAAAFSDVQLAVDQGKLAAYQIDHYMPAMQDDRLVGAVLAGLPTQVPPDTHDDFGTSNGISDPWLYSQTQNVAEYGHGTFQVGQKTSPLVVGLRDHSMRTPGQFQQNYPRELAINEAAALAGVDAIQFRIDNLKEERAIAALKTVRDASGWDLRPSPSPKATATGKEAVRGRGVSLMLRDGTYWACVCHIAVIPQTGAIKVEKCTFAVDPGVVINPAHLKRQVEGGAMMGISIALLEEAMTDESGVTCDDWNSYPILNMADIPEMKVVLINNPKVGAYGGGSEAANALAAPAIAAALHDATGKVLRRLPLKPAYVAELLKS
ncbi:xanthine dehydrogenase family protein molybdopterin-binding subunit [Occallatibacter riparius]|uniref:Molybdopterin-dependent oxidoreductase n=1 Tax=Occallatibacter riparius TaxID=1002689 RepID=A0A9J7BQC0_9BACT|nr:molybdopterin cofactor-binding domain-containing protein [Occallatibacter riparius]UWZ83293.1 molybdopterin-dependent oxidoreductase [Occallatibacter riparius]